MDSRPQNWLSPLTATSSWSDKSAPYILSLCRGSIPEPVRNRFIEPEVSYLFQNYFKTLFPQEK